MPKAPALPKKPWKCVPNPIRSGAHKKPGPLAIERPMQSFPTYPLLERGIQMELKGKIKPAEPRG